MNASDTGTDPLERVATVPLLKALYHESILKPAAFFRARELLYPERRWLSWTQRILLVIGATLMLAGVVFFFAYNWQALHPFAKFGLIETALLFCAGAAWRFKLESLAGKSLAFAAAMLVGVFLAVYGQVYPTGAPAYFLFIAWAALIAPWVFIARVPALWLLWITIWNTCLWTYWDHGRGWWVNWDTTALSFSLAGLNAAFLIATEAGARFKVEWLQARWLRAILLIHVLSDLFYPMEDAIFGWGSSWAGMAAVISLGAVAGTFFYYRYVATDLFALALGMLYTCVIASSVLIRVLWDSHHNSGLEPFLLLFTGLCIVGVFALGVVVLRRWSRAMPASASADETPREQTASNSTENGRVEPLTMRAVLERLAGESLLSDAERETVRTVLFNSRNEKPTPWYVLAMSGIGAWIASLCFLGFVMLFVGDNKSAYLTMGVIWIGAAVLMHRTWHASFFAQLALAMSSAGHALILVSVYDMLGYTDHSHLFVALVSCVLCVILNPLYRTPTHRFLSAALALFWITIFALDIRDGVALSIGVLLALCTAAVTSIFMSRHTPAARRPLGFALALGAPAILHVLMFGKSFRWWSYERTTWQLHAILGAAIAAQVWYCTGANPGARAMRPLLLLVVLVLSAIGGAGLALGLALMALGYGQRERELTVIGIATLAWSIFFYYYNLELDLLLKSAVLFTSGGALLLLRGLTLRRAGATVRSA